jgi:hypothetical protein
MTIYQQVKNSEKFFKVTANLNKKVSFFAAALNFVTFSLHNMRGTLRGYRNLHFCQIFSRKLPEMMEIPSKEASQ